MVTKKNITFSLSEKMIKAINLFSDTMSGLSKSAIVSLALSDYFMRKDEFRNNPKFAELIGQDEIDFYEMKLAREKGNQ